MPSNPTACLIMIGNEILSGRTKDQNLPMIAEQLNEAGVDLRHVRVIPDVEGVIIETVNACRAQFDYVFTTGGIGPTHDDITTAAIAKAFGVPVVRNLEAERRLLAHYKPEDVNDARMKMADIPAGASLIDNPVSSAPGFQLGNVFVLAGVPSIARAMMDFIRPNLRGGRKVLTRSLDVHCPEGEIAAGVGAVQLEFESVEIGIYPKITDGMLRSTIVLRCVDPLRLDEATEAMTQLIESQRVVVQEMVEPTA